MKILAIGNSFSEDAMRYLHELAEAGGMDVETVNLYIGGCSMETHWNNIQANAPLYMYQHNGQLSDRYVSIQEALDEKEWDVITCQQASHDSGLYETYEPYCIPIYAYLREKKPNAELWMHKTWAYETDSAHPCFVRYDCDQQKMYEAVSAAYEKAAAAAKVRVIPCGDVVQKVRTVEPFIYQNGGISLCRDGFHMHMLYGRYLLAAVWYETLCGGNILENSYVPKTEELPDAVVDMEALQVIKKIVHDFCSGKCE